MLVQGKRRVGVVAVLSMSVVACAPSVAPPTPVGASPTAAPLSSPASPPPPASSPVGASPPAATLSGQIVFSQGEGLAVANGDGSAARTLSGHGGLDFDPSWSPDGASLVFRTDRGEYAPDVVGMGAQGIFVLDLGTGEERQLYPPDPSLPGGLFPDWSPDGKSIVLSSQTPSGKEEIVIVASATGTILTRTGTDGECSEWSPDGSRIAFCRLASPSGKFEVWTMAADGSDKVRLTDVEGSDDGAIWSPDGSMLAFRSQRNDRGDVYVMRRDGSGQTLLLAGPGSQSPEYWLPDGRIVVASNEGESQPLPKWFVMDADGSNLASLPALDGLEANSPIDWRPVAPPEPPLG